MHIAAGGELPPDLKNFLEQGVRRCRNSELRAMQEAARRWAAMVSARGPAVSQRPRG